MQFYDSFFDQKGLKAIDTFDNMLHALYDQIAYVRNVLSCTLKSKYQI